MRLGHINKENKVGSGKNELAFSNKNQFPFAIRTIFFRIRHLSFRKHTSHLKNDSGKNCLYEDRNHLSISDGSGLPETMVLDFGSVMEISLSTIRPSFFCHFFQNFCHI